MNNGIALSGKTVFEKHLLGQDAGFAYGQHRVVQKKASDMTWVLENNNRKANHEIVLRIFDESDKDEVQTRWSRIQSNLKKAEITFIAAIELTKGKDGRPNNRIHYHFLIDSPLSRDELKETMKAVCQNSKIGTYHVNFDLVFPNKGIVKYDKKKIAYFTKSGPKHDIILFKKGLRIQKFYYSKDWFIDENGNQTTRAAILKRLRKEHREKKQRESQN